MEQRDLLVPDRFERIQRASDKLKNIIVPVEEALQQIDALSVDLRTAGRGGFLIFRGNSGTGKSTFLNTLDLFRKGVVVTGISSSDKLVPTLRDLGPSQAALRVLVIEGREAVSDAERRGLQTAIHEINSFIRQRNGERTLIVWQCNTDDLQKTLVDIAEHVGGDTLVDVDRHVFLFQGPRREQYFDIAKRTIATLNEGASLLDLGVSDDRARQLIKQAPTIGSYLGLLRKDLVQNRDTLAKLMPKEPCRVWIVVVAGNEPEDNVATLTHGRLSAADIDRLLATTNANVVEELKRYPEKIGLLGTVLDAKILHLPILAALGIVREFASERLEETMKARGLSIVKADSPLERLCASDLGRAFTTQRLEPRPPGRKPPLNTRKAFQKLVDIASDNDTLLNEALGNALCQMGTVRSFETERDLGTDLTRRSDLLCYTDEGPVRLEIMWRTKTSRAEIANYTLTKLQNYGRAIGFLG